MPMRQIKTLTAQLNYSFRDFFTHKVTISTNGIIRAAKNCPKPWRIGSEVAKMKQGIEPAKLGCVAAKRGNIPVRIRKDSNSHIHYLNALSTSTAIDDGGSRCFSVQR